MTRRPAPTFILPIAVAIFVLAARVATYDGAPEPQDRASTVRIAADDGATITLVGTSLTAASDWPSELESHLNNCLPVPVSLDVVAKRGSTSTWGLEALPRIIATDPDIVVIEFAINDADLRIGHALPESRRNHLTLVETLRNTVPGVAVYLKTTNPALKAMERRRPFLAAHYSMYRELADELDIGLADVHARWMARTDLFADLPDGLHPTNASARAVIVPALSRLIAETLGAAGAPC